MHGDMHGAMRTLGVFSMEPGTLAEGEIAAYEAAIALIDTQLSTLLQELFPAGAADYGLTLWEHALGLRCQGQATEQRRQQIIQALSTEWGVTDPEQTLKQIRQICPGSSVQSDGLTVQLLGAGGADLEQLGAVADCLLPQLSPLAEIQLEGSGRPWNTWDSYAHNWNYYDRVGLPWGFYDTV